MESKEKTRKLQEMVAKQSNRCQGRGKGMSKKKKGNRIGRGGEVKVG